MIKFNHTNGPFNPRRRFALKAAAATAAAGLGMATTTYATAADFPTRPIALIVPWTPGGSTDTVLRLLAESASKHLGQPIVILNKPGGAGTVGPSIMAATAKPDGYTISQVALSLFRMPYLQNVSYDPLKDFTYIIGLSGYTTGIVVRADAPWKSWKELVDYARANPGVVTYATTGVGSSLHMTMEEISKAAGIKMVHIPNKGTAESIAALMGGHVMVQADSTGWAQMVDSGKFRLLVTWGEKRARRWPQVPTLKESGLDIVSIVPYGLAGPKGMDPAVVKVLHDAFRKALEDPAYKAVADQYDQEGFYRTSDDFTRWAADSWVKEGRLIKELGLGK